MKLNIYTSGVPADEENPFQLTHGEKIIYESNKDGESELKIVKKHEF
jgi:hypothetical protein